MKRVFTPGQRVEVSCPVYKEGKTFKGVVTQNNGGSYHVKIRNDKPVEFAAEWVKPFGSKYLESKK